MYFKRMWMIYIILITIFAIIPITAYGISNPNLSLEDISGQYNLFNGPNNLNSQYNKNIIYKPQIKIREDSTKWIDVETKQVAKIYYEGSDSVGKITPMIKDSKGLVIGYLPSIDYNGTAGSFKWDGTLNKSVNQANNPYTITLILNNSNGSGIAISNEHKIFVGRPVILLHGGLSTSKEIETTETFKELSKNHYVVAFEYLPPELRQEFMAPMGDIKNYSSTLQQGVSEIIQETGAKKVNIVSHSMGGLVARWYIEKLGGTDNIGKLVMIGTPNHGLSPANLFSGSDNMAGSQMAPNSKFLKELNSQIPTLKIPYYILASDDYWTLDDDTFFAKGDGLITFNSAKLPYSKLIMIHSTHWDQINDYNVINTVKRCLIR